MRVGAFAGNRRRFMRIDLLIDSARLNRRAIHVAAAATVAAAANANPPPGGSLD